MGKGIRLWSSNKAINNPSSVLAFPEDLTTQFRARRAARKPWAPPGNAIVRGVSAAAAGVRVGWEGRERLPVVAFSVAAVARALVLIVLAEGGGGEACCVLEGAALGWGWGGRGGGGEGDAPPRTKRA